MAAKLPYAFEKISDKTPVGSVLRSKEWETVPMALRESAQFSAGVESVRVLQSVQDRMSSQLAGLKEQLSNGKTAGFDRKSFITSIRSVLTDEGITGPADPKDAGTLRDITSSSRLGLIYDMQRQRAQEYSKWKTDQNEGALLLYPAQEFKRVEPRKVPRTDWPARWVEAGGQLYDGRMIALKTDPVWERLSRFGTPWPRFDWGSGMGLEDIDHDEAVSLGLLKEDEEVKPMVADFTQNMEASTQGLAPQMIQQLQHFFGDQVQVSGDSVKWRSAA